METGTSAEPRAVALDPKRWRSEGPLSEDEGGYSRSKGISLAYDPTAFGWVSSSCHDDVLPLMLESISGVGRRVLRSEVDVESRFDRSSGRLISSWREDLISRSDLADGIWQLAESFAEAAQAGSTRNRIAHLRMHCRLQQRASRLLHEVGAVESSGARQAALSDLTATYTFRPWELSDIETFVKLLDDEEIWFHLDESYPDPLTDEHARHLIEISNTLSSHEVLAVVHGDHVVGQVRLQFMDAKASPGAVAEDAEVSYWLGRPYWGQGLMTDIVSLYTLNSFRAHPLQSISAWVREANRGSIRVLEKSGYRYVGRDMSEKARGPEIRVYRVFRSDYLES